MNPSVPDPHTDPAAGRLPTTESVPRCHVGSSLPQGWHMGAFMQVFVRAYADGDGDGIGDLRGLTGKLDHLAEMGITGLWLMPIHPSADGDHGYAVTDYRAVAPEYGTLDDFDELLRQAHARGIGVILDYVINHCASAHPLFQAACADRASPWRRWFLFEDSKPEGWSIYGNDPWRPVKSGTGSAAQPRPSWYFGAFDPGMPDFDWTQPEVEAWHHDNLRFWLERGVDGFRFDAVGHLVENGPEAWDCQPQNHAIMQRVRSLLDGYQHRFMVCEAPGDPAGFTRSGGSAFAFDLCGLLIDAARGTPDALARVVDYHAKAPAGIATFLSNHDAFAGVRVIDQLGGDGARARLAAALLLTLPGVPFVYYGEEIGMAGHQALPADPALRCPMSWDAAGAGFNPARPAHAFREPAPNRASANVAAQRADAESLLGFYRWLLHLRAKHAALRQGELVVEDLGSNRLVFRRRHGVDAVRVVIDTGDKALVSIEPCGPQVG